MLSVIKTNSSITQLKGVLIVLSRIVNLALMMLNPSQESVQHVIVAMCGQITNARLVIASIIMTIALNSVQPVLFKTVRHV